MNKACKLADRKCLPCTGNTPRLKKNEINELSNDPDIKEWRVRNKGVERIYRFKNFLDAVDFINKIAEIAEEENHHPDLKLYNYNTLRVYYFTHAIQGLSENDFILAGKIERKWKATSKKK